MIYLKKGNQVAEINEEKNITENGDVVYSHISQDLMNIGFVEMTEEEMTEYLTEKQKKEDYRNNPKLSYEDMIVSKIRQRYTINQELAILRQRDTKPLEYQEYFDYVEQCKAEVKSEVLNDNNTIN